MAPDSPEKAANVEGAQNDATPHDVLLLYTCPCCGHSSSDWIQLVKHIEEHVQVTCLSCSNCMHIFSSLYRLKDYTGADPADEPHVCCHCPFKTRWYQNLKDHCVTHHKNTALMNGSNRHNQNYILNNPIPQTTFIAKSQPQNSIQRVTFSYNGNQPGCYVLLGNSTLAQNATNAAVPVNSFIPGAQIGSNCLIPQVMHLNPINPLPAPTVQPRIIGIGTENPHSNLTKETVLSELVPKLENPVESNHVPSISPIQKSANRTLPLKVPVNELLEKWSLPKVTPKLTEVSTKVMKAPPVPVPLSSTKVLAGTPPCRAPNGYEKSRKGIRTKPCPFCSHVARDSHSLKTHILTHTKEKPFACGFCDYRATQRAHIQKHMATHVNGNRRGKCPRNGGSQ